MACDFMRKPNVFIRGIYSTALTKMFIDAGYPIIFPSEPIQKRFNLDFVRQIPIRKILPLKIVMIAKVSGFYLNKKHGNS